MSRPKRKLAKAMIQRKCKAYTACCQAVENLPPGQILRVLNAVWEVYRLDPVIEEAKR